MYIMSDQTGFTRPASKSETLLRVDEQSVSSSSTTALSSESGYERDNTGGSFPPPSLCASDIAYDPSEAKNIDIKGSAEVQEKLEAAELSEAKSVDIKGSAEVQEKLKAAEVSISRSAQKPSSAPKRIETRLELCLKDKAELEKENEELKKQLLEMKELKEDNERLKEKCYKKNSKQLCRLDNTLQEKRSLENLCLSQSAELQLIKNKLDQLAEEKEALCVSTLQVKADKQQLTDELGTKMEELTRGYQELLSIQTKCNELKFHCEQLEVERNEIRCRLIVTQGDLAFAEEIFNDAHKKHTEEIQTVEGQRNDLQTQVLGLEEKTSKLSDDKLTLTRKLKQSEEKLEKSEEARTELTEQIIKLSSQVTAHFGLAEQQTKTAGSLKTKLETVEAERDEYLKQKNTVMRSLAERNKEKASLQAKVQGLWEKVNRYEEEKKKLNDDLNEANKQIRLFQSELNSMSTSSSAQSTATGNGLRGHSGISPHYLRPSESELECISQSGHHDHQPTWATRGHFDSRQQ